MNLQENIKRIMEVMNHNLYDTEFDSIRRDKYTNKFGETINLVETEDGDVYIKHQDYYNKYIKLDDLITVYPDKTRISLILHDAEKRFLCNFLIGTRYEYLIPHIESQVH